MTGALETRDLFEGAWYLTQGARLARTLVEKNGSGKPKVRFVFEGPALEDLRAAFRSGEALAEVTRLRTAVNELRDVLFRALETRDQ